MIIILQLILFFYRSIKIMNITGREDTPVQILKHPANDSTSKYLYSFSKSRRFPQNKGYTNTISYNLPSSVSKRKAGFGFGNRSKFFDGQNATNPSPGKYQSKSQFESRSQRKGHRFTNNRDEISFANYLKQMENTPAAYSLTESQVKTSRSYSMRPKTAYPKNYFLPNDEDNIRMKEFPGPGKYQTLDMLGSGRDFYNSKFKTQKQKSFNGGDRFYRQKKTPGPGDYKIQHSIEPDGIYLLSNMKGSGRRQILQQKRELQLVGNKETPGPGSYKKPSDFGHYDAPAPLQRPKTARS